MTLVWV